MLQALQRFPILLTLYAGFGVLVHDTMLDSAAITALKNPAYGDQAAATNDGVSKMTTRTAHVHVDHISVKNVKNANGNQPAIHPRNESEKKVVAQRRTSGNDLGHDFGWPV